MKRSTPRIAWLLSVALIASLLVPSASHAQSSEADLHYELGAERYSDGRYAEAIQHFLASQRLAPTANLAFNIAQTYGLLDRPVEAYNWYETYLTGFELDEPARERGTQARDALTARLAIVEVRTSPTNAELFVDRVDLGSAGFSPRRLAMSDGEHVIIARNEGHHENRTDVNLQLGRVETIEIRLEPIVGTLVVETSPETAEVRLAGTARLLGSTPLTTTLPAGEHHLVISLEGYIEQRRDVAVAEGETVRLEVHLRRPAESVAVLTVVADPPAATVLLDGEEVGRTPLSLGDLEPGARRMEVRAEGRIPWSTDLLLEPGGATRADVNLAAPEERMWSGWRWIGYGGGGAVLAAGIVLGVLALVHNNDFYEAADPTRDQLDRIRSEALAADILMGVGILTLGVTLICDLILGRVPESSGTLSIDR